MASGPSSTPPTLVLVCGEDEFAVKQRGRELYQQWCKEWDSLDHEVVDAAVTNSGEALAALSRLREALQTLPFFGQGKVVWLQNCNFLGDERAASTQAVSENLAGLAQELKAFSWDRVRLLITAGKVDKRKVFYKALEKIGAVETFAGWSVDDRDWAAQAEEIARKHLRGLKKEIDFEALSKLVSSVGPNSRQLFMEAEKLALYVGDRSRIQEADVDAVTVQNKQSRAFALGDAVGERNLQAALRTLDEELWEIRRNTQKSEIGLLYGLISKVRVLIFLKEMTRAGWIKPTDQFARFRQQLDRVPTEALPADRRFNPLAMNPYVLFKALGQAKNYTLAELTEAMGQLLECNQRLVLSSLDETVVLQQALVKIIGRTAQARLT